ncbi:MAG: hypothetical protein FWF15_02480 [Oscillospiraceae bacterium]|nr:hypothetical protein [Oscillospiraceae bacterium]
MRNAVVDIGSNTVKMNVYDIEGVECHLILSESKTLGLLNYNIKHIMNDDGIFKLIDTLVEYRTLAENVKTKNIYFIATASLRVVENREEIISIVKDRSGIEIELISGENEALLSFEGLKYGLTGEKLRSGIMIDMGGGSTEIIGFVDGLAVRALSLNFGSLSLFRKFVGEIFPSGNEFVKIKKYINKKTSDINWFSNYGDTVYLVGGTARAIGKLHAEFYNIAVGSSDNAYYMKYNEMKQIMKNYDIETIVRVIPDRIHTVLPGLCALCRLLKLMGTQNVVIAKSGLREGYILSKIKQVVL